MTYEANGADKPGLTQEQIAAMHEQITFKLGLIQNAAEIIGGEGTQVEKVFEKPPAERRDAPTPTWSTEEEVRVREIAHQLGYGAETNVGSGLKGGARILEGGLAWKIAAETEALADEDNPHTIVFAGSAERGLRDDEITFMDKQFGTEFSSEDTEFDIARFFAEQQVAETEEAVLAFGYDEGEGRATLHEATGQLLSLGQTANGQSVQLLRVDRGADTKTPKPNVLMRFIADTLPGIDPIGYMTSSTYASRAVDSIRAGIERGREFGVAMYGRKTLAGVKDEPMAGDSPLNQLPGDLRVTHDNLKKLQAELPALPTQEV